MWETADSPYLCIQKIILYISCDVFFVNFDMHVCFYCSTLSNFFLFFFAIDIMQLLVHPPRGCCFLTRSMSIAIFFESTVYKTLGLSVNPLKEKLL